MKVARSGLLLGLILAAPVAGAAQSATDLAAAGELERGGRYQEAAQRYRAVLRGDPTSVQALLGLERVLTPLNRLDSLVPLVRTALKRDSVNRSVRSLELRLWFALGRTDSITAAARRWIAVEPDSPDPYREWAFTVAQRGDLPGARRALAEGTARLGTNALAQDLAQLTTLSGDWTAAARQWVVVVQGDPGQLTAAATNLARAPGPARNDVLSALLGARSDSTSRLMAADVMVVWGRADEAWPLLDATLPADRRMAAGLLQRFADRAATTRSRPGALARAYALERLVPLVDAVAAGRVRMQAAQAYADAGDLGSAQRMLDGAGAQPDGAAVAPAMASLIRALAEQGSVTEAERQLSAWNERLAADDREEIREAIAWAWMRSGELDRAEAVLAPDSGVAATALRGWIATYRGDIAEARDLFRAAGPFTGSREEATQRLGTLVLLERVGVDRLPELGHALQQLARGDTTQSLAGLDAAAKQMGAARGRGDILAFAGELAVAHGAFDAAGVLLRGALTADSTGPSAPAAELALAQVEVHGGRTGAAIQQLEHLILAHAQSALVPQARRLLDRLRGAVPQ